VDERPVPILSIDSLSVEFRTRKGIVTALHDVGFEIGKREMVGVVGESGSGKSVTAFNVMGILDPAGRARAGSITFGGLDMLGASEHALREVRGREVSMIFQNPKVALNPIRPVGKQIGDVLRRHTATPRDRLAERAVALLAQVKIADPERRYWAYPFELSGGMCQRVMIAIALACEPALLIADEPTTGLDVTTQKTIMDLVRDLATERAMACMLITHDLGLAAQYCHRIVVMEKGRVVEQARTRQLFASPIHPYTRKLIRATPRPESTLADFAALVDEAEAKAEAPALPPLRLVEPRAVATDRPLMQVTNLVKEFPIRRTGNSDWMKRLFTLRHHAAAAEAAPRTFRAVDNVSFEVRRGESIGLVGESGCGKSTTSRLVTRLLDATSGTIEFDGLALHDIPAWSFAGRPERSLIQMVFQDPTESLNPRFSAFDVIADPLRRLGGPRATENLGERIEGLARMVGLPADLLTRYPHQLSGGQKARVGIARAIALEPRLLVLDEPTSALDVSVQAVILRLLDRLRGQLGLSYIFVSHDLNVVRLLCDRVIVMNRGRIVETGPADALLANPKQAYTRTLVEAIPHFRPDLREAV
jgi:peptide/nickel transport system ATP-binding protein